MVSHPYQPSSPVDAVSTMCGLLYFARSAAVNSGSFSFPPYELLISVACTVFAAVATAAARSSKAFVVASTRTILQTWQIPRTACTSSAISPAHLLLAAGSGDVKPDWLTTLNVVEVSVGRLY